ncbi:hypothetical protein ONE63_010915 [Megalurothrips usitatus]|uniref:Uncharacterized protein n=1 Tax=Megalurothrips usitatus TaxID=439358 RepID=A0AAV7XL17_9NEOP|nr:hypothetical protein ONE63_010915 [Megalurothrips usitatus]
MRPSLSGPRILLTELPERRDNRDKRMGVLVAEAPKSFAVVSTRASARAPAKDGAMVGRYHGSGHGVDDEDDDEDARRPAVAVASQGDAVVEPAADSGRDKARVDWAPPRPKKKWIRHFFANGTHWI